MQPPSKEKSEHLAVHAIIPCTVTNGPGRRFGLWVQGCGRKCRGCFNPDIQPYLEKDAGAFGLSGNSKKPGWIKVGILADHIKKSAKNLDLEGISISGGEPFEQPEPLYELIGGLKDDGMSVLIFTGYTLSELLDEERTRRFFRSEPIVDVLIDGPFIESMTVNGELRGSSNQEIRLLTDRYAERDLIPPGPVEAVIGPDGEISYTGFTRTPFSE